MNEDMVNNEETIGKRLKLLRQDKNMTQRELADLLYVSDKTISKWEKDGSIPDIDIILEIAGIFDVTLDYLLVGGDGIRTSPKSSRFTSRSPSRPTSTTTPTTRKPWAATPGAGKSSSPTRSTARTPTNTR